MQTHVYMNGIHTCAPGLGYTFTHHPDEIALPSWGRSPPPTVQPLLYRMLLTLDPVSWPQSPSPAVAMCFAPGAKI